LYEKLNELIKQRRSLYNGLLFAEHECEQLEVSNKMLEKIFKNINYPLSPYHFDEIGVEILGSIYERFLGKTIRLTQKQVRVDDKPEVCKAGGVYYTPQYIVDYIVENTVGKLLYETLTPSFGHPSPASGRGDEGEGKKLKLSPKQVSKLKIIDIACGSGSFLLGAFQKLIDYHVEWYTQHPEDIKEVNGVRDAYEDPQGRLVLSARKKREILVNNIFGVDIDPQAVEVTQMSLYLKVLEDENDATLNKPTMLALHEVLLPPLKNNIKCGNSLIGTDFLAQGELFDDEARRKLNPFDWEVEFPNIMKNGGFDVVIGNPPYVRQESLEHSFKDYVKERYSAYQGTADLYVYFVERAHRLLHEGGLFGMICSGKFMRTSYGKGLRQFLIDEITILQIIDFGELPVFEAASTFPIVLLTMNRKAASQRLVYAQIKILSFDTLEGEVRRRGTYLDHGSLYSEGWSLVEASHARLLKKLKSIGVPLRDVAKGKMFRGILTGLNEAFVIDAAKRRSVLAANKKNDTLIEPFVIGDDVRKFQINQSNSYLILIPNGWTRKHAGPSVDPWKWLKKHHAAIANHLQAYEKKAEKRLDKGEYWWELRPCDYYDEFEKPKIVWPEIAKESRFTIDQEGFYLNKTCFFMPLDDPYLLALLNSKVVWFFLKNTCSVLGDPNKGGRLLQQKIYIDQIPIRTVDLGKAEDKKIHDDLVALVNNMLDLHEQVQMASFDSEKEPIQRQIAATDKKIDGLVYKLYGLTQEEIKIVEGNNRS
jgi:type I restriction-modification system DNA methylase subunit